MWNQFKIRGSIGYKGERRIYPGNKKLYIKDKKEDYCVFLFTAPNSEELLKNMRLSYLTCGEGSYLDSKPDELVSIFGHPGSWAKEGPTKELRPLRISWGLEKTEEENTIRYDNDTLPGNSGSPVIGRGGDNQAYCVKGIHVRGSATPPTGLNEAQSLKNLANWIQTQT